MDVVVEGRRYEGLADLSKSLDQRWYRLREEQRKGTNDAEDHSCLVNEELGRLEMVLPLPHVGTESRRGSQG